PDPGCVCQAVYEISGDIDGIVDPDSPRDPARYTALDRPRRSHRQGLDQPTRRAGRARRADRGALFADTATTGDNAWLISSTSHRGEYHAVERSIGHRYHLLWRC